MRTLVINLGSTSTKLAVFQGLDRIFDASLSHPEEELRGFASVWDQEDYRREAALSALDGAGLRVEDMDVIASRCGNVKPVPGGMYRVVPAMLQDMESGRWGAHPAGVGCRMAYRLGEAHGIPVLTADPPVTDELFPLARYSGAAALPRISSFHALNQKRTARVVAERLGRPYEELDLIVVHLGGGISVAAHHLGRVIDVNNALDGDGPFSPERAGALPTGDLIRLCFSGAYTQAEVLRMIQGDGGLMSYLGTKDCREVERRIAAGDAQAREVYEAMAYQVGREIGAAAAALRGRVDAVAFTGSLAYSSRFLDLVRGWTDFLAPVVVCPGEHEMLALAEYAQRYWAGEAPLAYGEALSRRDVS